MYRLLAAIFTICFFVSSASSAELIWKDRWNDMDRSFRRGYAAGVFDTVQVLNPGSIKLMNMSGASIDDDLAILLVTANKCLEPLKQVSAVRLIADSALGDEANPKAPAALDIFLGFVGCTDTAQLAYVDKEKSEPLVLFMWKDRWDRELEQAKNGYAAGVADSVIYLATILKDPVMIGSTLLLVSIGRCGSAIATGPAKIKTFGDILTFSERAIGAQRDLFQLSAESIIQALKKMLR